MSHYFLPAEWYPQDAVMLTWPHAKMDWQPILAEVELAFIAIAEAILSTQSLVIVTHDEALKAHAAKLLCDAEAASTHQIHWVITPTDDTWARDHGPITVVSSANQHTKCLDFVFNAWGGKFASSQDDKINHAFFTQQKTANSERIDFILEGGGIESDNAGSLLTTTTCLLNENRNQEYSQEDIENLLKKQFGVTQILWLENGYLCGDDTDSHIDTLARFAPNNQMLYVKCDDPKDEHYSALQKMEAELKAFTNANQQSYHCIALPWPSAKYNNAGERLPATYANFLIINNKVLVPTYRDAKDADALHIFQGAFPDYEIIGIDCLKVIEQYGSLHCLTMQLPQGVLYPPSNR